jgi:hypothetical protein
MKSIVPMLFVSLFVATVPAAAQTAKPPTQESEKETREDIAKHRAIAAAHLAAAACREAGKGDEVCNQQLQTACKGIAIGRFCGMKHEH